MRILLGKERKIVMGMFDKLKSTQPAKKNDKKSLDYLLIFIVIVIVGLLYLSSFLTTSSNTASTTKSSTTDTSTVRSNTTDTLETKLKAVLSKIEGAGEVDVLITYETGTEIVPAVSVDETSSSSSSTSSSSGSTETKSTNTKPVTIQSNGETVALVLYEKEPVVKGVIVVAEGAGDIKTKLALQRAVQTVLDVDSSSIDIFTMKK